MQCARRVMSSRIIALTLVGGTLAFALTGTMRAEGPSDTRKKDAVGDPCIQTAVDAIQSRYASITDLRANFRQITRSVALGKQGPTMASKGTVQFSKPGKMRWSYDHPEPSLVVSDGVTLWLYDATKREAQKLAMGTEYFSAAGIHFLLGEGEILEDFRVSGQACNEKSLTLELEPLSPASYDKLKVLADPKTGDLLQTQVIDLFGNETVIDFSHIEVDHGPPASVFEFVPPDGVRVIELGGGKWSEGLR